MERDIDRRISVASAVMQYWSVVVKDLSWKAKFLIYSQSTFPPSPMVKCLDWGPKENNGG